MKVELISSNGIAAACLACGVCTGKLDEVRNKQRDVIYPTTGIQRAIKSGHYSVLEHITFSWIIEDISRQCLAQLTRHRHNSYSVMSQRYCVVKDDKSNPLNSWYYTPECFKGSDFDYMKYMQDTMNTYKALIDKGIKPEDARSILPNATYTNLVLTTNARALIEQCNQRLCNKAQKEIRDLYTELKESIKDLDFIYNLCVPNCVRYGKCLELKSCKEE